MNMTASTIDDSTLRGAADLLDQYRAVLRAVENMHDEARQQNWIAMEQCAHRYRASVDVLRDHPGYASLDATANDERRMLLAAILRHDAAVRDLISPAQARVGALLTSLRRQSKLLHSYGAHGGVVFSGASPGGIGK